MTISNRTSRIGALLGPLFVFLALGCPEPAPSPTSMDGGRDAATSDAGYDTGRDTADANHEPSDGTSRELEQLLRDLRDDRAAAIRAQAADGGWPASVAGGSLFVSLDPALSLVAGEFDDWTGTAMTVEDGFAWLVLPVDPGTRYKFTDGAERWEADPWSRAYEYDEFGVMSMTPGPAPHLERFFEVGDANAEPRQIRVWVPDGTAPTTHLIFAQDGQNLFDPAGIQGGWRLQEAAPAQMMIVGIDNTAARFDEYTHSQDEYGGQVLGGEASRYAAYVVDTVWPLVERHYSIPERVGVIGSSLGGVVSFYIADRYPDRFQFAASMSGTMGWGSIALDNDTTIDLYAAAPRRGVALYLDSGGAAVDCFDGDGDGIEDDADGTFDNYCENRQLEGILIDKGYEPGVDMWHWWEPGARHGEPAWAARVFRPLQIFSEL